MISLLFFVWVPQVGHRAGGLPGRWATYFVARGVSILFFCVGGRPLAGGLPLASQVGYVRSVARRWATYFMPCVVSSKQVL